LPEYGLPLEHEMRHLLAAATLAASISPAIAGVNYDHRLEEQVKRIVAASIGDIRGTLPFDKVMVFPATGQVSESPSFQTVPPMPVGGKPHFQVID
jgi:hypothetical protein